GFLLEDLVVKCLVTGGGGYKGLKITQELLNRGHEVTILDTFYFGFAPVLHLVTHPRLNVIRKDVRDNLADLVSKFDTIIHLAGISGFPACIANPGVAYAVNVEATQRLVKALSPQQLLVFASTTAMYEVAPDMIVDETTTLSPNSIYTRTKREGELICLNEHDRTVAFRVATVMGVAPRMRSNLLVNDFVARAIYDRSLVLYFADAKRTFIHIDDCVRGYMMAIDKTREMAGSIYNLGSEKLNYSKLQIAHEIKKHVECDIILSTMPDKDSRNFVVSFDRIKKLGFDCTIDLSATIDELVKLYRFYKPDAADERFVF
ncbi:MAG: NAD(P)-dependent oxidoreductase, partial [Alphaproteobacteria bacterium]